MRSVRANFIAPASTRHRQSLGDHTQLSIIMSPNDSSDAPRIDAELSGMAYLKSALGGMREKLRRIATSATRNCSITRCSSQTMWPLSLDSSRLAVWQRITNRRRGRNWQDGSHSCTTSFQRGSKRFWNKPMFPSTKSPDCRAESCFSRPTS